MNKIRDLIIAMPRLCGVEQHERWSKMLELVYDYEASNKDSVFARKDGEEFHQRCQIAFQILDVVGDFDRAEHCLWLLEISDRAIQGKIPEDERKEISRTDGDFPEVDSILKPSEAATILAWSPDSGV